MPKQMRFALAAAGLLFLMPLIAGILKLSAVWLLAFYAVFILNAVIGAKRVGREGGIKGMQGILIAQGVMIVIFYLIGRFVNLLAMSGDRIDMTPTIGAIFVVIALAAIGAGMVASKPAAPAEKPDA